MILESKVCELIENQDVASNAKIEYENMPDLIDLISEDILDDEILKSKYHLLMSKLDTFGYPV